ncbi:hypothetical protein [Pseudomonas sp. MWU12-2323]|uniref:hypothetical protein n=1 Tax=Pseudomonas sp. MWU12-2323 TaxID=2651296 RepID=UPI00128B0EB8|nr:hypothetical protein [Pseudomonas sp. MWU12-2323]MPQ69426.1 hypothetical protein [Pseudomonas sp. MWU12-2323]
MNEAACTTDLNLFELDRCRWLQEHGGSMEGFTTKHGAILAEHGAISESLKAHLKIPAFFDTLVLTSENRGLLGASLNSDDGASERISDYAVSSARSFVGQMFCVDLSSVIVIRARKQVMPANALGTVYSHAVYHHVIVVPEFSFDPMGILVRQFAIAAHYTCMRQKPGLAALMTDNLTQSMVGHYALLRFASLHPEECAVMRHLQLMVSWEFAKGLSKTPQMPMGFVASDLGGQLMRDYGGGMFKAVMTDLYESMTHGQAIWFGSNNFTGMVLALTFLGDDHGMTQFMRIDSGDRALADKITEAFPGIRPLAFEQCFAGFNAQLARMIQLGTARAA